MTNSDLFSLYKLLLRKNGISEPQDAERFELLLQQENLSYFKELATSYSKDQDIADSLSPFEVNVAVNTLTTTTSTITVPNGYARFISMYYTDGDGYVRPFDLVTDEQWDMRLRSTITVPSDEYPICKVVGDNIYVSPYMNEVQTEEYLYYGVGSVGLTPTQVGLLTSDEMGVGNKMYLFSPSSQVCYFAYPASYGNLVSILDNNNFDVFSDWTKSVGTINSVSYNIYAFNNLTTQTNFYYTFKF